MKNDFSDIEQTLKAEAAKKLPEFNEEAWHKMEALLDKDERRPKAIFWFSGIALILLLLTALYFMNRKSDPDTISNKRIINTETAKEKQPATTATVGKATNKINDRDPVDVNVAVAPTLTSKTKLTPPSQDQHILTKTAKKSKGSANRVLFKSQAERNNTLSNDGNITEPQNSVPVSIPGAEMKKPEADSQSTVVPAAEEMPAPAVAQTDSVKTETKKKTIRQNRFFITGVIGLGTDKTSLGNASKLTPKYGVGAGFTFNNKWSVGLGVRVHRKIYTAGPDDYRVKSGYWSMVDIQEVDANCLVYEIPVTINYNLFEKNNYQVFASAGFSSFIMKKEKYDFSYINTSGQPAKGSAAYTGNKHFFSSINLGIGVSKKLNKRIQLFAVPTVALPVNGIGEGAIRLKSFEIAAGINYFLFK